MYVFTLSHVMNSGRSCGIAREFHPVSVSPGWLFERDLRHTANSPTSIQHIMLTTAVYPATVQL